MDSGTESYLHKKFKKQLSIDPRKNDKENDSTCTEKGKEKKTFEIPNSQSSGVAKDQMPDNNEIVPNQSTNQYTSTYSFALQSNFPMSSISIETSLVTQSLNSCISYVNSNHITNEHIPSSFDIKYSEPTNFFNTSSISTTENIFPTKSSYSEETQAFDYTVKNDEMSNPKTEEIPPPPDKNSSGKYVCAYCNLVCSKPSVLQKHIRAHTNERPYPCKSCGFSFKTRSNLYKHCRSRTHANRVMGNKVQDSSNETVEIKKSDAALGYSENREDPSASQKPYKPRFHTRNPSFDNLAKENIDETQNKHIASEILSHHINEIINKNNSIVNSEEISFKKRSSDDLSFNSEMKNSNKIDSTGFQHQKSIDEPLNLTNKNRKRTMSEVSKPVIQKSLIKELLLQNLSSSDMQCPYCKMIFQTVTELDVHKYRNCKGKPSGVKYTRSSSVNVASILTQNKNAFDNIPHLQNTIFPLKSPGPFLGKTRLVESDKTKSFSFDSGNLPLISPSESMSSYLSPLSLDKEKKAPIKLFGGEVKVHTSANSYGIDRSSDDFESDPNYMEYGKLSENRVIQSSLQSGGTVLTSKSNYNKMELKTTQVRVYENISNSPTVEMNDLTKQQFSFDNTITSSRIVETNDILRSQSTVESCISKYSNIVDFSQKAVKMLTPNIKQPSFTVSSIFPGKSGFETSADNIFELKNNFTPANDNESIMLANVESVKRPPVVIPQKFTIDRKTNNLYNPMKLFVNGKIIRHVPGMPGPLVAAETDLPYEDNAPIMKVSQPDIRPPHLPEKVPISSKISESSHKQVSEKPTYSGTENYATNLTENISKVSDTKLVARTTDSHVQECKNLECETKKFARPTSLALKPTTAALKQHHGLTPTMFNQILISPDTPRVAKKYAHHFLHGNYFSYLGLKSSTKPVYCTLNKTQPFYVPHFKKLSMYSEWRQQDTKQDKLYASNYDTKQRNNGYSIAGKTSANLIIHSSYKFIVSESTSAQSEKGEEMPKTNTVYGGYECNDEYTYIRGRGRGRYVCDQCGIRCKKPSMLKKHIRTHSNDRPFTCSHCNFSFKTKGNLTKHMKSKAHTKNYTASGGSSSSTQHSAQSSESDTEDSGMDSSDESTRQQEHEAAYGLLSLSQKPTSGSIIHSNAEFPPLRSSSPSDFPISSEEVAQVSKTNYARNKFLNDRNALNISSKNLNELSTTATNEETTEAQNIRTYLGKCISRPLTYPYTSILLPDNEIVSPKPIEVVNRVPNPISVDIVINGENVEEPKPVIQQFHVIQKYTSQVHLLPPNPVEIENKSPQKIEKIDTQAVKLNNKRNVSPNNTSATNVNINNINVSENMADFRKRKFSEIENLHQHKIQRNDEVMDLSMATQETVNNLDDRVFNNIKSSDTPKNVANEIYNTLHKVVNSPHKLDINEDRDDNIVVPKVNESTNTRTVIIVRPLQTDQSNNNYSHTMEKVDYSNNINNNQMKLKEYDNSAMETLADVATKQVKLEKNTLAKCVASEFLKLATKNENIERDVSSFGPVNKDVNDLIVKSEGNKSCTICSKSFNKPSQLRLHMNIHYLERPFRCDSCSVSFRTKGHLQKHERSASHHNKLSSSPAFSSSEPRPFKCSDCNIAFRIHGHLAKHLRSKMHIMKLECLSKIPFGLYAELERSNSLLTEINTTDGDQCLESLKTLAKKVFINNPNKLNQLAVREDPDSADCL